MFEAILAAHVLAAIVTTLVVFRLDYCERPQAVGQSLVAWLIPFFGAAIILIFQSVVHRNMTTKSRPDPHNAFRDEGLAQDLHAEVSADD